MPRTPAAENEKPSRSKSPHRQIIKKSETVKTLLKALSTPLFLQDVVYIDGVESPTVELSENVQTIRDAIVGASEDAVLVEKSSVD